MTALDLPIVQYWHADPPDYIVELLGTFRDLNPELRHMVFDEPAADSFIEDRFTAREVAAFRACAIPAMQADYFRYCAVLALGGIYSDADFRCVAPLASLLDGGEAGRLVRRERGVINSFFGFKAAGHPLLELALEVATTNIEDRISNRVWLTTGPAIFTALAWLHESGSFDTLLARARDTRGGEWEPLANSLLKVLDGPARIEAAFADVETIPFAKALRWIARPAEMLPYKRTSRHWVNQQAPIFR